MKVVIDENVSLEVVSQIRQAGVETTYIAELGTEGLSDSDVYDLAVEQKAILITRDNHFTNHVRFPPSKCAGILYVRHGNLSSREEAELVTGFLQTQPHENYAGHLVTLYRDGFRLR